MSKVIYGVALNGTSPVTVYNVLLETPKTYTIDRPVGSVVRKCAMADRWMRFYEDRSEAEAFLHQLLERQAAMLRKPDIVYIYRRLLRIKDGINSSRYIDDLIKYTESFLAN